MIDRILHCVDGQWSVYTSAASAARMIAQYSLTLGVMKCIAKNGDVELWIVWVQVPE